MAEIISAEILKGKIRLRVGKGGGKSEVEICTIMQPTRTYKDVVWHIISCKRPRHAVVNLIPTAARRVAWGEYRHHRSATANRPT